MLNYLRQYGHVPFSETPMSDVDRLVISQLAYVDLQHARRGMSFSQALACACFDQDADAPAVRFDFQRKDDMALCTLAAAARRYEDIRFEDFICVYAPEVEAQFAALTLRLPDGALLIAFRGTDNTLAGWKEDFNMAFLRVIPSQAAACGYAAQWAAQAQEVEVCGHSKGGNLALFAAAACEERVQQKIRCAVSFDGPGLTETVMESPGFCRMESRMRVVMPRASLVGRLFQQPRQVTLVESRVLSVLQHYPYFWKIKGMDFVRAEAGTVGGAILSGSVKGLMERVPVETREHFVEAVYEIISATRAETVNELLRDWGSSALAMARKLRQTDAATYKLFLQVAAAFWRAALAAVGEALRQDEEA